MILFLFHSSRLRALQNTHYHVYINTANYLDSLGGILQVPAAPAGGDEALKNEDEQEPS